jgi:hypothetical protein
MRCISSEPVPWLHNIGSSNPTMIAVIFVPLKLYMATSVSRPD